MLKWIGLQDVNDEFIKSFNPNSASFPNFVAENGNMELQLKQFFVQDKCFELFAPDPGQMKVLYQQGLIDFPYWSQVWPAARALSAFLLENTGLIQQKNVLELAAGLGLPSFVSATAAKSVICSDYLPVAVDLIQKNIRRNQCLNMEAKLLDWNHLPADLPVDVLLLSDVNYDPDHFNQLQKVIRNFLSKGSTVLLSTPERLVAKDFIAVWQNTCRLQQKYTIPHAGQAIDISVLALSTDEISI